MVKLDMQCRTEAHAHPEVPADTFDHVREHMKV
jgi:hypothetical protein